MEAESYAAKSSLEEDRLSTSIMEAGGEIANFLASLACAMTRIGQSIAAPGMLEEVGLLRGRRLGRQRARRFKTWHDNARGGQAGGAGVEQVFWCGERNGEESHGVREVDRF